MFRLFLYFAISQFIYFKTYKREKDLKEACMGTRIPHSIPWFQSMIYLPLKQKSSISDIDNCIESKFQCKIKHGSNLNVYLSFLCMLPAYIFLVFGSQRWVILPNKVITSKLAFGWYINILVLNIGRILFIPQPARRDYGGGGGGQSEIFSSNPRISS